MADPHRILIAPKGNQYSSGYTEQYLKDEKYPYLEIPMSVACQWLYNAKEVKFTLTMKDDDVEEETTPPYVDGITLHRTNIYYEKCLTAPAGDEYLVSLSKFRGLNNRDGIKPECRGGSLMFEDYGYSPIRISFYFVLLDDDKWACVKFDMSTDFEVLDFSIDEEELYFKAKHPDHLWFDEYFYEIQSVYFS